MPHGSYMSRHCNIGKALPILSSEAAPMWPSPAVSGETHSSARSLGVGTLTDLSYGWTIQESEGNPWWKVVSYCNILHFAIKIHLKKSRLGNMRIHQLKYQLTCYTSCCNMTYTTGWPWTFLVTGGSTRWVPLCLLVYKATKYSYIYHKPQFIKLWINLASMNQL